MDYFAARGATHFARVHVPFRPYITHAAGSRKWDVDGHEYIDYVMGHGALVLGHSHPDIVRAVQEQAAKGLHYGDNHELEIEWSALIRQLMPTAERIEFCASGQEANAIGLRLGRAVTGRKKILRIRGNYHGWLDELTNVDLPGVVAPEVALVPPNDLAALEERLAARDIAVLLVEGGGGFLAGKIPTQISWYKALPELARKYDTVFMLDEVVTGFREAKGGWQEVVGITPDITSIGKAVSGGMASGALLGRADLFQPLDPDRAAKVISHGGTWNAVPITAAAGIAACNLYLDGEPQRVALASGIAIRDGLQRGTPAARRERPHIWAQRAARLLRTDEYAARRRDSQHRFHQAARSGVEPGGGTTRHPPPPARHRHHARSKCCSCPPFTRARTSNAPSRRSINPSPPCWTKGH